MYSNFYVFKFTKKKLYLFENIYNTFLKTTLLLTLAYKLGKTLAKT